MRAALETLSIIEDEKLVENALEVGKKLKKALSKSLTVSQACAVFAAKA